MVSAKIRVVREIASRAKVEDHAINALKMAIKLSNHPLVETVYHPALETTINHHIWKRDFSGSSGLFAFSLKKLHSQNKIKKIG